MKESETRDINFGYYKFQITLFLMTIIFIIMHLACHFRNILELNSHFQKMLYNWLPV